MKNSVMKTEKNQYFLFLVSIPIFFIFSTIALYFIKLEVWVEGVGTIKPKAAIDYYLFESAQLLECKVQPGDFVSKGQILAIFQKPSLLSELNDIENESQMVKHQLIAKQIEFQIIKFDPIPEKIQTASSDLVFIELKEKLLQERLNKLKELTESGILSKSEEEELFLELKENEKNKKTYELRNEVNTKQWEQLIFQKEENEIERLKKRIVFLEKSKELLTNRVDSLVIKATHDGRIISPSLIDIGRVFQENEKLFTLVQNNECIVEVKLNQKDFIQISKGLSSRFQSNAFSIYEYDYFWGKVNKITPSTNINQVYTIEVELQGYGKAPIGEEESKLIPFGSDGKCAIAIGHQSLLLQLIGWN